MIARSSVAEIPLFPVSVTVNVPEPGRVVSAGLAATVSGSAGSTVQITDAAGSVIAEYTCTKTFGSVVFSCPAITSDQTYTETVDGTSTSGTAGVAAAGGMGGGMGRR